MIQEYGEEALVAKEVAGTAVLGDNFATELFADDALGFSIINGVVRITLASARSVDPIPPSPMHYVTVGRLIMPCTGAQRLAVALNDFLAKQGFDPSLAVKRGKPLQ